MLPIGIASRYPAGRRASMLVGNSAESGGCTSCPGPDRSGFASAARSKSVTSSRQGHSDTEKGGGALCPVPEADIRADRLKFHYAVSGCFRGGDPCLRSCECPCPFPAVSGKRGPAQSSTNPKQLSASGAPCVRQRADREGHRLVGAPQGSRAVGGRAGGVSPEAAPVGCDRFDERAPNPKQLSAAPEPAPVAIGVNLPIIVRGGPPSQPAR